MRFSKLCLLATVAVPSHAAFLVPSSNYLYSTPSSNVLYSNQWSRRNSVVYMAEPKYDLSTEPVQPLAPRKSGSRRDRVRENLLEEKARAEAERERLAQEIAMKEAELAAKEKQLENLGSSSADALGGAALLIAPVAALAAGRAALAQRGEVVKEEGIRTSGTAARKQKELAAQRAAIEAGKAEVKAKQQEAIKVAKQKARSARKASLESAKQRKQAVGGSTPTTKENQYVGPLVGASAVAIALGVLSSNLAGSGPVESKSVTDTLTSFAQSSAVTRKEVKPDKIDGTTDTSQTAMGTEGSSPMSGAPDTPISSDNTRTEKIDTSSTDGVSNVDMKKDKKSGNKDQTLNTAGNSVELGNVYVGEKVDEVVADGAKETRETDDSSSLSSSKSEAAVLIAKSKLPDLTPLFQGDNKVVKEAIPSKEEQAGRNEQGIASVKAVESSNDRDPLQLKKRAEFSLLKMFEEDYNRQAPKILWPVEPMREEKVSVPEQDAKTESAGEEVLDSGVEPTQKLSKEEPSKEVPSKEKADVPVVDATKESTVQPTVAAQTLRSQTEGGEERSGMDVMRNALEDQDQQNLIYTSAAIAAVALAVAFSEPEGDSTTSSESSKSSSYLDTLSSAPVDMPSSSGTAPRLSYLETLQGQTSTPVKDSRSGSEGSLQVGGSYLETLDSLDNAVASRTKVSQDNYAVNIDKEVESQSPPTPPVSRIDGFEKDTPNAAEDSTLGSDDGSVEMVNKPDEQGEAPSPGGTSASNMMGDGPSGSLNDLGGPKQSSESDTTTDRTTGTTSSYSYLETLSNEASRNGATPDSVSTQASYLDALSNGSTQISDGYDNAQDTVDNYSRAPYLETPSESSDGWAPESSSGNPLLNENAMENVRSSYLESLGGDKEENSGMRVSTAPVVETPVNESGEKTMLISYVDMLSGGKVYPSDGSQRIPGELSPSSYLETLNGGEDFPSDSQAEIGKSERSSYLETL